ncbi:MAG: SIS domain-containing protein [Woeseiaceae bacterium]
MTYLGYSESRLIELDGYWTAREIEQQPESWRRTIEQLVADAGRIAAFIEPILQRRDVRIILTGAGTSAFAGASIAPSLSRLLGRRIEAIATTDLVSGPDQHFHRDLPTLVVSFARSGNSPESVAAVRLAEAHLGECYQLVLSCNADGELYRFCNGRTNCLTLLMPEETNDRAFAMTSSFTSMLLAAISMFTGIETFALKVARLSDTAEKLIRDRNVDIKALADNDFSRVIYLGSNGFKGLAQEASLKLLELTNGRVFTLHESSLGIRHGPKTVLKEDTLVVIFMSGDSYTRNYDTDLLNEVIADGQVTKIVALTPEVVFEPQRPELFKIESAQQYSDLELLFPYVVFAQIYAFHHAVRVGNRPDNPNPSGTVNRVVKGVKIHSRTV